MAKIVRWVGESVADGKAGNPQTYGGWVDVLVDCPGAQGIYTYGLPAEMAVQPGDILSVPFGAQQVGAIALKLHPHLPPTVAASQVRPVDSVINQRFFSPSYWTLLERVATYYQTPLMQVIRAALPPGLLAKSQRRIRLRRDQIPADASAFLPPAAQKLLLLLQQSSSGDYTWQYLQQRERTSRRALDQLLQRGWVESYLAPPQPPRPKRRQAVTVVTSAIAEAENLTSRQRDILIQLQRQGGELWLSDALQLCQTTSATLKRMATSGHLVIDEREVLRQGHIAKEAGDRPKSLTPDQQQALTAIAEAPVLSQILLHGVTGSGKTEVYLQAIAPRLAAGQSALVLVPEIGLTPQLTDRFHRRFGELVCVYHSGLSDGERYDTWRQMLTGQPQVVIGTRSAVFAPLPHLGLIILDEEHDSSFKQDQPQPCYHARTIARWRAELEPCQLILGSATPSLESWIVCGGGGQREEGGGKQEERKEKKEKRKEQGETGEGQNYGQPISPPLPISPTPSSSPTPPSTALRASPSPVPLRVPASPRLPTPPSSLSPSLPSLTLSLPHRIQSRPLPPIEVVDMRQDLAAGNRSIFSRQLQSALMGMKAAGGQGILFIHRRGHSSFVSCRSCGYVMMCPHCDVSLSFHQTHQQAAMTLKCHYCGYGQPHPRNCPECASPYLKHFGSGTQRVERAIAEVLPDLSCIRFDSDTTRTKGAHRNLLTRFAQGGADLLVGTQMLTKGIDLPQVTLVGIIAADGLLYMPDYWASERAFQLLTQVAGRAGRGDQPGQVILQTYTPDHPVIEAVRHHRYEDFIEAEWSQRQEAQYPPAGRLVLLRFTSPDATAVKEAATAVSDRLRQQLADQVGYELLGPAPAPILRVARRYRWQLLLKSALDLPIPDLTSLSQACSPQVSLTIDVEPLNLG